MAARSSSPTRKRSTSDDVQKGDAALRRCSVRAAASTRLRPAMAAWLRASNHSTSPGPASRPGGLASTHARTPPPAATRPSAFRSTPRSRPDPKTSKASRNWARSAQAASAPSGQKRGGWWKSTCAAATSALHGPSRQAAPAASPAKTSKSWLPCFVMASARRATSRASPSSSARARAESGYAALSRRSAAPGSCGSTRLSAGAGHDATVAPQSPTSSAMPARQSPRTTAQRCASDVASGVGARSPFFRRVDEKRPWNDAIAGVGALRLGGCGARGLGRSGAVGGPRRRQQDARRGQGHTLFAREWFKLNSKLHLRVAAAPLRPSAPASLRAARGASS